MGTCIYCSYEGALSEEHHLPEGLGTFRGYEMLKDRVCSKCNERIGREIEEEFLRSGPIAFFREIVGAPRKKKEKRHSPFDRGTLSRPALKMEGKPPSGDYDILWEVVRGTQDVRQQRQVVVRSTDGQIHCIPIRKWMTEPDHLRAELNKLNKRKIDGPSLVTVIAAPEEREWVLRVISCLGDFSAMTFEDPAWTEGRIPLVVTSEISMKHYQAVAKIAFHYTLKQFPYLTGRELEFQQIRDAILTGKDVTSLVKIDWSQRSLVNFPPSMGPKYWMHVITVTRTTDQILAHCQFFLGPQHRHPPIYDVLIGRSAARIHRPAEECGHAFIYVEDPAYPNYDGVMDPLQSAQYVKPVWGIFPPIWLPTET